MLAPRNLLWLIPLLLAVSYPLWRVPVAAFLHPVADRSTVAGPAEVAAARSAEMEGIVFSQTNKGREEWQVRAKRLVMRDNENDLQLEKLQAVFLGQEGGEGHRRRQTRVASGMGHYDATKRLLDLRDNVRMDTDDGYAMQVKRLSYAEKSGRVRATAGVKITGPQIEIQSQTLEYDTVTGAFSLADHVRFQAW